MSCIVLCVVMSSYVMCFAMWCHVELCNLLCPVLSNNVMSFDKWSDVEPYDEVLCEYIYYMVCCTTMFCGLKGLCVF